MRVPVSMMAVLSVLSACSSPQGTTPTAQPTTPSTTNATTIVSFTMGNAGFAAGDLVTVTSVKGTSSTIDVGGTYTVEGTWKLGSRDEATLALYSTNGKLVGTQSMKVKRGTGTFSFTTTIESEGFLHVSYYPADQGSSFGGAYFGTGTNVYRGSYVPGP